MGGRHRIVRSASDCVAARGGVAAGTKAASQEPHRRSWWLYRHYDPTSILRIYTPCCTTLPRGPPLYALVIFHIAGGMGAGDVKLMAAVGCLAGLPHVTFLLVFTAIAGGVMGVGLALLQS